MLCSDLTRGWYYWCPQYGCYVDEDCIDDYPPDDYDSQDNDDD
jgi:hypothetical protein